MFGIFTPVVPQVTAEDVKKALDSHHDVVLLDVRTSEEFAKNRIKGAVNLSVNEISKKIVSVVPDKKKRVYVYCLSGSRSAYAVDAMKQLGYTNVYSMTSGLLAWRTKQYALELL